MNKIKKNYLYLIFVLIGFLLGISFHRITEKTLAERIEGTFLCDEDPYFTSSGETGPMHVILKKNGYIARTIRGDYTPHDQGTYFPIGKYTYQYMHFYAEQPIYLVIKDNKLYFNVDYGFHPEGFNLDIKKLDNYESSEFCTLQDH